MHKILIALDSVGIDPLGHDRPESVYSQSRFLFPRGAEGEVLDVAIARWRGALVETEVVEENDRGAIECAITYTSIFSGRSAVREHGLMRGLGLKERLLEQLVTSENLFRRFEQSCLANALFPAHLEFFGNSYVQDRISHFDRDQVEQGLTYHGRPVSFRGAQKNGFAELFTLAEINQNIFVFAAREAGVTLRTWQDVRQGQALTSSMTHELEGDFDVAFFGQEPLPPRTPERAAEILGGLSRDHDFTFYKYQIPDLVSHTGQVESARAVFAVIERFIEAVLAAVDPAETVVIVTSDHGHLEQLSSSRGHPGSKVPTWYFGAEPDRFVERLQRPEGIFHALVAS
ncbi:MAG TPA: hypothetical protein VL475_10310 [Planctomycetaceae bacterium]|nr:hypothetical protein [Planctomycetaceae bacterium]